MKHHKIDLNLLIALDALLRTASVTRAAAEVHVSQPSMSGSLARLREHFADPLLVRSGRTFKHSPLAQKMQDTVRQAMQHIDRTLSMRPTFDPAADSRQFTLSGSDFTVVAFGSPLVRRLSKIAPTSTVSWLPGSPTELGVKLQSNDLDLSFVAEPFLDDRFAQRLVLEDDFACISWLENAQTKNGLTKDAFNTLGHVGIQYGVSGTPGASHLSSRQLGACHRIETTCTSPIVVGSMVVGTQRIATVARSLALQMAASLPLRVHEHPLQMAPLRIFMQWNQDRDGDGAMDWLRSIASEVASELAVHRKASHDRSLVGLGYAT